ncbi:Type IV secretory pathway, VirB3 component precursor [Sphingobium yanoikuyae]|uniref:Type IV secretory pathway, VirB3 component n=1 Tax=Sphingobium yanoikuyae TaxID=13690 RepID=A0A084EG10_SPHYA|nr:VirB3 family type IV secretion system protein [Sphingobium yanoikuyae]KEZ16902.1 Type IV secretory pathway, VirB3 component precursor [Sphingobium yanoikuyae]
MTTSLKRDTVFVALTRPQMFAGVSYNYFIINAILTTELFLLFKSAWVIAVALPVHFAGMALSLREPRFLDLWIVRVSRCPRIRNHAVWGCNSYRA